MKAPFRKSNHAAVLTPDLKAARDFYENVMELELFTSTDEQLVFKTNDSFFYVDDLDVAKDRLVSKGCQIIKWEGKGKDCYLRDPFGMIFNLWEETTEK